MGKRQYCCTFALLGLAGIAPAQVGVLTIADGILSAGATTEIAYENPDRANETVVVRITDSAGATFEVVITLDANGRGEEGWTLPEGIAVGGIELGNPAAGKVSSSVIQ